MTAPTPDGSGPWTALQPPTLEDMAKRLGNVEGGLHRLTATVGHAPNDATGDPGSGMARVLAEVAQTSRTHQRKMIGAATLGAGGVVGAIEAVLALLRSFG